MVFPATPLDTHVELLLGDTWTDITTPYVYGRNDGGITITYGGQDESSQADASSCTFEVDNTDGRFSTKNPNGAYYGQLRRGTPVRVSVNHGDSYLAVNGTAGTGASTPDAAALDITGDIDVRIEASLSNWFHHDVSSGALWTELIGKMSAAPQYSWMLIMNDYKPEFQWTADGTNRLTAQATEAIRVPSSGHIAIRVTLDVNNGAAGRTITFYTSDSISGTWTQLGEPVVQAGVTSIFSSTSSLSIGDASNFITDTPTGKIHAAEVRNGIAGSAVANPNFRVQTPGATSFVDGAGRTWTVSGDSAITNRDIRFYGHVVEWPVRWQEGGKDVHVQVQAAGPLRRLGQGASPLHSALYREYTKSTRTDTLEYWPLEDGSDATEFSSAIEGHAPMTISGDVTPSTFTTYGPSEALPTVEDGVIAGNVSPYFPTGEIALRAFVSLPTTPVSADRALLVLETTGTVAKFIVWMNNTNQLALIGYDPDGTQLFTSGFGTFTTAGTPCHVLVELTQDGSDVDWALVVTEADRSILHQATPLSLSGTLAGRAFRQIKRVRVGGNGPLSSVAIGHIILVDDLAAFTATGEAMNGWRGELSYDRFRRLMKEEGQAHSLVIGEEHIDNDNARMGNQGEGTLLGLARTCEAVSNGVLYEHRESRAIVLRDGHSMYNQDPAITLDHDGDDGLVAPLEPTEDDQFLVNDMTINRTSGGFRRFEKTSGVLNVNDPEDDADGVGRYDSSETLDLFTDDQAEQFASFAVEQRTLDETRWPRVTVYLQKATAMMDQVTTANIGDVLAIDNLPTFTEPGQVKQIIRGYTEFLSQFRWEFTFNCSPAGAYYVGEDDATDYIRADTDGSELAEALDTTEAAVDVLVTDGPLWVDTADFSTEFPFDVTVGGEEMTVTAIADQVSDTFTRNETDTWGTSSSGQAWSTSGGAGADYDVVATYGAHTLATVNVSRRSFFSFTYADAGVDVDVTTSALATGGFLSGGPTLRYADSDNLYVARLEFTTANAIVLSIRERVAAVETQLGTATLDATHVAGTFVRVRFEVSGTTLRAKAWVVGTYEPGGWMIEVTDSSLSGSSFAGVRSISSSANTNVNPQIRYDNYSLYNPQRFTVTRSANGIVKTHAAGASLSLARPARIAL